MADISNNIDWLALEQLAQDVSESGLGPGGVVETRWLILAETLNQLRSAEDWAGIIRLRELFTPLLARDTAWGLSSLKNLDTAAIQAAKELGDQAELAHLLGARGHNLHRQGYHQEALEALTESANIYKSMGKEFQFLKNHHMTALCLRALGEIEQARQVLLEVLEAVEDGNPWRGNPLQVLAWLRRDAGYLEEAEILLREALTLHRQNQKAEILIVGTLAELAEVVGLQNRLDEATQLFKESLTLLAQFPGQYDRQEARTKLKFAEMLIRNGSYQQARKLLKEADDKVSRYGDYYDLVWQIELARAYAYLRTGNLKGTLRKLRATLYYRNQLGLSHTLLVKRILVRLLTRLKLP